MIWMLSAAAAITGMLHIRADLAGAWSQTYVFKPATLVLLIVLLLQAPEGVYRHLLLAGLAWSLCGDVMLMLRPARFVAGLVSFLVAHLCYIVAFASRADVAPALTMVPYLVYGAAISAVIMPHMGRLAIAGAVYLLAILAMSWLALQGWLQHGDNGTLAAFAGSLLFVASDTVLAVNRFLAHRRWAQPLTLSTYYLAQWLIVLSAF